MATTRQPQSPAPPTTLHQTLHARDAQISSLLHQLHSISDQITSLQKDLHTKSTTRKHQREEHTASIKALKEDHAAQRQLLANYESKIKSGGGLRMHEYASLMKAANANVVESSYVIRLQAQLCRAMHSLGVMESQLALVKENCSTLIKCMKEDLSLMVDDRTRREIELMNTLALVDAEKRAWQAEMEKKLREQEDLLESVRDEYEELGLEYDEDEVRGALEVQALRESVERVKKEKGNAESDLLGALLEREEMIGRVRGEMEGLEDRLRELRGEGESESREGRGGEKNETSGASERVDASNANPVENVNENDEDESPKESVEASPSVSDQAPATPESKEQMSTEVKDKTQSDFMEAPRDISDVTSKLNDATLKEASVEESQGNHDAASEANVNNESSEKVESEEHDSNKTEESQDSNAKEAPEPTEKCDDDEIKKSSDSELTPTAEVAEDQVEEKYEDNVKESTDSEPTPTAEVAEDKAEEKAVQEEATSADVAGQINSGDDIAALEEEQSGDSAAPDSDDTVTNDDDSAPPVENVADEIEATPADSDIKEGTVQDATADEDTAVPSEGA